MYVYMCVWVHMCAHVFYVYVCVCMHVSICVQCVCDFKNLTVEMKWLALLQTFVCCIVKFRTESNLCFDLFGSDYVVHMNVFII